MAVMIRTGSIVLAAKSIVAVALAAATESMILAGGPYCLGDRDCGNALRVLAVGRALLSQLNEHLPLHLLWPRLWGPLAQVGVDGPGERRDRDDEAAERIRIHELPRPLGAPSGVQGGIDLSDHARAVLGRKLRCSRASGDLDRITHRRPLRT